MPLRVYDSVRLLAPIVPSGSLFVSACEVSGCEKGQESPASNPSLEDAAGHVVKDNLYF